MCREINLGAEHFLDDGQKDRERQRERDVIPPPAHPSFLVNVCVCVCDEGTSVVIKIYHYVLMLEGWSACLCKLVSGQHATSQSLYTPN